MKKPGFVITETLFSLVLAASVAAVAVLAIDLKTNQFHIDEFNPFVQESSAKQSSGSDKEKDKADNNKTSQSSLKEISKEQSSAESKTESSAAENSKEETSEQESSKEENSKKESSKEESSKTESSKEESSKTDDDTIKLVSEPDDLKKQPEELVDMLGNYGYSLEGNFDGNKIIFVDTLSTDDKSKALVYCYQKSESTGYWWNVVGNGKAMTDKAYIGENGSAYDTAPDSKVTPAGIYLVGSGFYIKDKPDTSYELFEITDDTYWVTDPESKYYNQLVEGTDDKDWSSADHMITSEKSYKYGLVINYNTSSPDSKKASAIFMHCGSSATEGSIAVPENVMKTILEWLDDDSVVSIFINL